MPAVQNQPNHHLKAVLGPTNTGKTHLAVERMLGHKSGMIGLPLRLLAREVYDKVVAAKGKTRVALITGEEKILPPKPAYYISTTEAMPLSEPVSFMAIDEIQLAGDRERGHTFTNRLLNARGSDETMLMGASTIEPIIRALLPGAEIIRRARFSELSYVKPKKLTRLAKRTAVIAFSLERVYAVAELLRRTYGGVAVVMGALSPTTRNRQVELYQSGEVDYIVATDAIGMGLNMDIDHVVFADVEKFDGRIKRKLTPAELAQVAGRAGRYMNSGTFTCLSEIGDGLTPLDIERIENHRFPPLKKLQWRSSALDYGSVPKLIKSLQMKPDHALLSPAEEALDLAHLKTFAT
ncbi:MAG: helicase-related protein, partial [Sphingomonadales bacterium]